MEERSYVCRDREYGDPAQSQLPPTVVTWSIHFTTLNLRSQFKRGLFIIFMKWKSWYNYWTLREIRRSLHSNVHFGSLSQQPFPFQKQKQINKWFLPPSQTRLSDFQLVFKYLHELDTCYLLKLPRPCLTTLNCRRLSLHVTSWFPSAPSKSSHFGTTQTKSYSSSKCQPSNIERKLWFTQLSLVFPR